MPRLFQVWAGPGGLFTDSFEYPRRQMTSVCPFWSFNISETEHFIKNLTMDIIVTSKIVIDKQKNVAIFS